VPGVSEGETLMAYHRLRAPCVVCKRTMLPFGRGICYRCLATLPDAPRFDRGDDDEAPTRPPRPLAAATIAAAGESAPRDDRG
jgi:hypothetical protein